MLSHSAMGKYISEICGTEWERYIVLLTPSPLPETTSARVTQWEVKLLIFLFCHQLLFVRRLWSACHVEMAFALLGHILTHDRLI